MIHFTHGDIFAQPAEAIVNPVNCVGVAGAGLALQFKRRHPDAFLAYRRACCCFAHYLTADFPDYFGR